jgi:hypothetical protein
MAARYAAHDWAGVGGVIRRITDSGYSLVPES